MNFAQTSSSQGTAPMAFQEDDDAAKEADLDDLIGVRLSEDVNELERLKKEKMAAFHQIERYKKWVTYCILLALFSFALAMIMIVWRFSDPEPTFAEAHKDLLDTSEEEVRLCITVYPDSISSRKYDPKAVGEPLILTPLIREGRYEEAAEQARVQQVLQSEISYSGFLQVDAVSNANLFFWFFPARRGRHRSGPPTDEPLVIWLQGGPGWPSMYGLFKENGPYLVGWDNEKKKAYLVQNKFSWTDDHHMLYIDNPVGAGFSYVEDEQAYPQSDAEVADALLLAIGQFMKLFPAMTRGQDVNKTRVYAFGESYGGSYVVSLAHAYLQQTPFERQFHLKGLGIGNGFLSAEEQSLYAEYFDSIGYVTKSQKTILRDLDSRVLKSYEAGNYSQVITHSQNSLTYFTTKVMNLTNVYDFTFDGNYLTNSEYVCFLQREHVRKGIHVGGVRFHQGHKIYTYLNESVMVSKKPWLNEILEDGSIEVLIYNGNLDVIVHVPGTNRLVRSLNWSRGQEFAKKEQDMIWVWNEDEERGELAGYYTSGGGLTYVVVRNAGHMVPISQPRWALHLVKEFTHVERARNRFRKPREMKRQARKPEAAFKNCQ